MTFDEAIQQYNALCQQLSTGVIDQAAFHARVGALQVVDGTGRSWTIDPVNGGWLVWNGSAWQAADPSTNTSAAQSNPAQNGMPDEIPYLPTSQMTQDADALWRENAGKPLGQRSNRWWDMIAILGGGLSGYLWFTYSSVRGMPQLQGMSYRRESWLDFVPALLLLAVPILGIILRRRVLGWVDRLLRFPIWVKLLGGGLLAIAACVLTYDRSVLFQQREGLSVFAPMAMVLMPIGFVWLRRPIDKILMPLQAVRRHIPRPLIVIAGIGIPILIGFILYYVPGMKMREYPLLNWNIVIGTILSYVILRTPRKWTPPGSTQALRGIAHAGARVISMILLGAVVYWLHESGWADDFLRDPFNLNDGLRTNGVAPILSGGATSIVSVLINGVEVVRTVITDPNADPDDPVKRQDYSVVVDTINEEGVRDTTLDPTKSPVIFIYAHCEKAGAGRFPPGDSALTFSQNDAHTFVSVSDIGMQNGRRCARVQLVDPAPSGTPPKSVSITIGGGQAISAPLTLMVEAGDIEIEWNVVPEKYFQDGQVVIPGDGKSEFQLNCWAVKRNPETGARELFENVDFTHMLQPDDFPHQVFGIKENPPTGTGHRQTETDWINRLPLPSEEYNTKAPADAGIRVKAWQPAGEITRLAGGRIEVNEAKCKAVIRVPVRLEEVKVITELVLPEMPIPADGEKQELTLRICKDTDGKAGAPQKELPVSWEAKESKAKWKSTVDALEGVTDDAGEIRIQYTTPKLQYRPDGIFHEDFTLYRGSGEKRVEIGEFRVRLAPRIALRVSYKKGYKTPDLGPFGLIQDPVEVVVEPMRKAHSVRMTLLWQPPEDAQAYPVFEAPLKIEWQDEESGEYTTLPVGERKRFTDKQGQYLWEPPELKKAFEGKGEIAEWKVEDPTSAHLTDLAQKTIQHYADKVTEYCPMHVLSDGLREKLTTYPKEFRRQVAEEAQNAFPRLRSAAELLRTAAGYSKVYMDLYTRIYAQVIEQITNLAIDVFMTVFSLFDGATRLLKWGRAKLANSRLTRFLGWLAGKFTNRCQRIAQHLQGLFSKYGHKANAAWTRMTSKFQQALQAFRTNIDLKTLEKYGHQELKKMGEVELRALGAFEQLLAILDSIKYLLMAVCSAVTSLLYNLFAKQCEAAAKRFTQLVCRGLEGSAVGQALDHSIDSHTINLIAKGVDTAVNSFLNMLGGLFSDFLGDGLTSLSNPDAEGVRTKIADFFNNLKGSMEKALTEAHANSLALRVPVEFKPQIDAYREHAVDFSNRGLEASKESIRFNEYAAYIDEIVFAVQMFVLLMSLFFAWFAAPAVASGIKALDVVYGSLKSIARAFGPAATLFGVVVGIFTFYWGWTRALYKSKRGTP